MVAENNTENLNDPARQTNDGDNRRQQDQENAAQSKKTGEEPISQPVHESPQ
jgi:hypothetical protein